MERSSLIVLGYIRSEVFVSQNYIKKDLKILKKVIAILGKFFNNALLIDTFYD